MKTVSLCVCVCYFTQCFDSFCQYHWLKSNTAAKCLLFNFHWNIKHHECSHLDENNNTLTLLQNQLKLHSIIHPFFEHSLNRPGKKIIVFFPAWERSIEHLWSNPCAKQAISPITHNSLNTTFAMEIKICAQITRRHLYKRNILQLLAVNEQANSPFSMYSERKTTKNGVTRSLMPCT